MFRDSFTSSQHESNAECQLCYQFRLSREGKLQDFPGDPVFENLLASAGDMVPSLVWEHPACCGATKPVHH